MSKNILVTGGTSGIGRAICERFAAGGYNVITCARTESDLDEMKLNWNRHFPESKLIALMADLSIGDSVEEFISALEPGSIHVLVNNTGVYQPGGVLDSSFDALDNQIKTNLYSAYFTTRGVLKNNPGVEHIFNVCSIASLSALSGSGIYCISKFALYGLSQSLRLELRDKGIKVTSVLPGATWSRSWAGAEIAADRLMPAGDIAESIWMAYHTSPSTVIEEIILRPQLGDFVIMKYNHTPFQIPYQTAEESLESAKDFYHEMNNRRSVRFFSDQAVSREVIEQLVLTAGTAPSGAHKQPWKFCIVECPELKLKIREAAEKEERESYESRMSQEWLEDLAPLGTDWEKPFLTIAPYLIIVFRKPQQPHGSGMRQNYYVQESVGIACGLLLAAIHKAGLVALTHTPSPMNFLQDLLNRPSYEKPYLLIPVGYPASDCTVPDLKRKELNEIAEWF